MKKDAAFWVKGSQIYQLGAQKHIDFILKNLDKFNITREEIEEVHEKHNEKIGQEGKAREEIIRKVAKDGWIRIRYYAVRGNEYWSIQCDKFARRKESIFKFIDEAMEKYGMNMNDPAIVMSYDTDEVKRYPFQAGGIGELLKEEKEKKRTIMDELKRQEIQGRILEQSISGQEAEENHEDSKEPLIEVKSEEGESRFISEDQLRDIIEEEASKQVQEAIEKLQEDPAGRTEYSIDKSVSEEPPSFNGPKDVVYTAKEIVDKGNYMNIKRLAVLIAQTADLVVGEFADIDSIIAPEANQLVKKYFVTLREFVSRLP